jgi:hypothetical protein
MPDLAFLVTDLALGICDHGFVIVDHALGIPKLVGEIASQESTIGVLPLLLRLLDDVLALWAHEGLADRGVRRGNGR